MPELRLSLFRAIFAHRPVVLLRLFGESLIRRSGVVRDCLEIVQGTWRSRRRTKILVLLLVLLLVAGFTFRLDVYLNMFYLTNQHRNGSQGFIIVFVFGQDGNNKLPLSFSLRDARACNVTPKAAVAETSTPVGCLQRNAEVTTCNLSKSGRTSTKKVHMRIKGK